jgi:hypothetical protein
VSVWVAFKRLIAAAFVLFVAMLIATQARTEPLPCTSACNAKQWIAQERLVVEPLDYDAIFGRERVGTIWIDGMKVETYRYAPAQKRIKRQRVAPGRWRARSVRWG